MPRLALVACLLVASAASAVANGGDTSPACTPRTQQELDAAAFEGFDTGIGDRLPDVQSLVVLQHGRVSYQYHREGNPEALRDVQSVTKTALAALVGAAIQQGQIASLDAPVVQLVPEWQPLNADPRTQAITLRHLLALTPGFEHHDPTGTAAPLSPTQAWQRALRSEPGRSFLYDNSVPLLIAAVLQKATGLSIHEQAQARLVQPLGLASPSYANHLVKLRTIDMARLGQLFLQDGQWDGRPLLPPGFAAETIRPHSGGGPPARMPYGLAWWLPSSSTFMASGFGGQWIWVHPPLQAVVAATSTVSPGSNQRGQAMQLIRGRVFQAMQTRAAAGCIGR